MLTWALVIIGGGLVYLYKGILFRGLVIYFLVKGIRHAREIEQLRKEISLEAA